MNRHPLLSSARACSSPPSCSRPASGSITAGLNDRAPCPSRTTRWSASASWSGSDRLNDPSGKEGLCQLAWSLLANGEAGTEIDRRDHPGLLSHWPPAWPSSMDKEMAVFSGTIHKDNLERYYGILRDMLLDPGFREDDFARLKTDQLDLRRQVPGQHHGRGLGQGNPQPDDVRRPSLRPLRRLGRPNLSAGLTLEEAKAFYKDNFVRGNIVIGLAGGYPADFPKRVEADFNDASGRVHAPASSCPPPCRPQGLEFVLADKPTPGHGHLAGLPGLADQGATRTSSPCGSPARTSASTARACPGCTRRSARSVGQNYGDYAYIEHFVQGRDKFPAPNHSRPAAVFLHLDPAGQQRQPPFRHPPGPARAEEARRGRDLRGALRARPDLSPQLHQALSPDS